MASVRRLKKDIDSVVFEVISDCFAFGSVHPDEKEEEVTAILADAAELRNDLIRRINNPEGGDDPKAVKSWLRQVEGDLYVGVDKLFMRLSALSSDKN